jgi:hypothetical protein
MLGYVLTPVRYIHSVPLISKEISVNNAQVRMFRHMAWDRRYKKIIVTWNKTAKNYEGSQNLEDIIL